MIKFFMGYSNEAAKDLEIAASISSTLDNKNLKGSIYSNLGMTCYQLEDLKKAIEYYEQALKTAKEIGDRCGEGNRPGNMGLSYIDLGKPRKEIESFKESLAIGKAIEDLRIISFCEQKLKDLEGSDE